MLRLRPPLSDEHRTPRSPATPSEFFPPRPEEMERNLWETIQSRSRAGSCPLSFRLLRSPGDFHAGKRYPNSPSPAFLGRETRLDPGRAFDCVGAARWRDRTIIVEPLSNNTLHFPLLSSFCGFCKPVRLSYPFLIARVGGPPISSHFAAIPPGAIRANRLRHASGMLYRHSGADLVGPGPSSGQSGAWRFIRGFRFRLSEKKEKSTKKNTPSGPRFSICRQSGFCH